MKGLNEFISEKEHFKGGKADNLSLEDIAKKHDVDVKELQKELDKGIEIELEHTDSKDKAEEIAKDHLIEFPDYYTRLIDMEKDAEDEDDTIEITVDLDIPNDEDLEDYVDESGLNERNIRHNKRTINSSKVVRETTEELFGKEGTHRDLADRLFKVFKKEIRRKAKDLRVPINQVRQWKITLRDFDDNKVNTKI